MIMCEKDRVTAEIVSDFLTQPTCAPAIVIVVVVLEGQLCGTVIKKKFKKVQVNSKESTKRDSINCRPERFPGKYQKTSSGK
jgi:hypothetical protein